MKKRNKSIVVKLFLSEEMLPESVEKLIFVSRAVSGVFQALIRNNRDGWY